MSQASASPPVAPAPALPLLGAVALVCTALGLGLVAVGVLSGTPVVAAVAAVGLLSAPLALNRPALAAALLVAAVVTNMSAVVGEVGGIGLLLPLQVVAAGALVKGFVERRLALYWSPLFAVALVFLATRGFSLLASPGADEGLGLLLHAGRELLLLPVLTLLLVAATRDVAIMKLAAACLIGLAALTVIQEYAFANATTFGGLANLPEGGDLGGGAIRHSGPMTDANFWARHLVLFLPLAASFGFSGDRRLRRIAWLGGAGAMLVAITLTQSRGGMLAAAVAGLCWAALLPRRSRGQLLLALPLLLAVVLLVPGVGDRLLTLARFDELAAGTAEGSLVERAAIQRGGLAALQENPVTGVGPGRFGVVQQEYARRLGLPSARQLAAHNVYLEMAVEGGLPGLVGWLLLYGTGMLLAGRALLRSRRREGPAGPRAMASSGILTGLVGYGVASTFLHLSDMRGLLLLLAFAAAVDIRERLADGAQAPRLAGEVRVAGVSPSPGPGPLQ